MIYNDDEQFPSTDQQSSGKKTRAFIAGKTKLTVHNKTKVPFNATKFSCLLELEGYGSKDDTPGVDIVAVLDTSGPMMFDNKLERMKTAMQFLIQKLSPNHRLSVVTFSNNATRLCPLRRMTPEAQDGIGEIVKGIYANSYADISKGLQLALQVLDQRRVSERRVSAIILMSPGNQHRRSKDARQVKVDNVPVFTFGVGKGEEVKSEVLNTIATNSKGGTFSVTDLDSNQESNNLSIALAKCLAGVLTVVVQDLKLTVTKLKPEINIDKLSTKYPTKPVDGDADSQLISFGDLYSGEKRTVLVHLDLPPATNNESGYEVLDIPYSYDYDGEEFEANPVTVSVIRTKGPVDDENEKVASEMTRLGTVDKMQNATDLANKDSFGEAKTELQQALDSLGEAAIKLAIAEILKSQVTQLLVLVQNPDEYRNKGPQIALAILTSHYRQREAATGDDLTIQGLFSTPTMTIFVNQAISFIEDPKTPVQPFTKNDVVESKPKPVIDINQTIGTAIQAVKTVLQSLEDIQVLLNSDKKI